MAKDLLLEIGLEEMPARMISSSREQLEEKMIQFLDTYRLNYASIQSFSTPRRLAIQVFQVSDQQEDIREEMKGPAKTIAQDAAGNWTKAAEGFARGKGVTTKEIYFKEINGVDYAHVMKYEQGQPAFQVLSHLKEVITSLTFPVTMRWGNHIFDYIRPIHWLVALLDDQIIPFSILDVQTGARSKGHRFLGDTISLQHAREYEQALKEQFVIVNPAKRKNEIIRQIEAYAQKKQWLIDLDKNLLEEVNNLVEYPTTFIGDFDEKYLFVPQEVLITSMKEHQRYFSIHNHEGRLLPHFVSVRNGDYAHIQNVKKGNEKVLVARLEDAAFFYKEDQKLSIEQCIHRLKTVTFHEKIGTIYEKMQRVALISQVIGKQINLDSEEMADLKRATEIYKFDLVTNMVGEFPELQGIMGEKYALLKKEKAPVARAIREHYLPLSSESALPQSKIGAVLAVADKLDSVLTFFSIGMVPTGSNDPYALRRQAYGIVRIIHDQGWAFPLKKVAKEIIAKINQHLDIFGITLDKEDEEVITFIKARIKQLLLMDNMRHDVIEAVISANQQDITKIFQAAVVLTTHLSEHEFKPSMEALTRVINLVKKEQISDSDTESAQVNPALFENETEINLHSAVNQLANRFEKQTIKENYHALIALRPWIEAYFEQTMIMVEDKKIQRNRLNELKRIAQMIQSVANTEKLTIK